MGVGSQGSPRLIRSVERPLSAARNFRFGSVTAPSDWPRVRVSRRVSNRPGADIDQKEKPRREAGFCLIQ